MPGPSATLEIDTSKVRVHVGWDNSARLIFPDRDALDAHLIAVAKLAGEDSDESARTQAVSGS